MKLLIILIALLVSACGSNTTRVVTDTQVIIVTVPKELLITEVAPEPPNKELYLTKSPKERERILGDYIQSLILNIKQLNKTIAGIDKYNEQMKTKKD